MRPGEPVRSTLRDWLQACGACHAAGPDLSALPAGAKAVVESPAYRALSLEAEEDTLLFRRWAMICLETGDKAAAAEASLQGAWAADDAAGMTEAVKLRREVAALWGDPAGSGNGTPACWTCCVGPASSPPSNSVAPQWRRVGWTPSAPLSSPFSALCAAERDVGCHLLSSAAPDHALPSDLATPKFWEWLFRD